MSPARLAQHIEISREHTLGLRPMRWNGSTAKAVTPAKKRRG